MAPVAYMSSNLMSAKRISTARPQARVAGGRVTLPRSSAVATIEREATVVQQHNHGSSKGREDPAVGLNRDLEYRAKAIIALEEAQLAQRPQARISLHSRIGLGESWKICGAIPELGRMSPEVAPTMKWTEGDVWVYEGRVRPGNHAYKAVLRNAEGMYIWEEGQDRTLVVPPELGSGDQILVELDVKMP